MKIISLVILGIAITGLQGCASGPADPSQVPSIVRNETNITPAQAAIQNSGALDSELSNAQ